MKTLLAASVFLALTTPLYFAQDHSVDEASSRWGREYFPNVELTTHEGKKVRFFDDLIEDKVVMINFIYTNCPDACPLETGRLLEVQGILGDRVGKDVFIYSISIDPARDTPEVLKAFAEGYQAGPGWTFLTGDEKDITLLRKKLGLYIDEIQNQENPNDHNLSLIIGNQSTGRWMKRSPFENPYVLAAQVGEWLHNWKDKRDTGRSFENAPELRSITKGESLFRTRCAVCHTIGAGDGLFRVGPNLFGATDRRDRDWLERWLTAPDVMLAAKDPIATELFERYNKVAMPNLRLQEKEIVDLLGYLEAETRRVEKTEAIDFAALEAARDPNAPSSCCLKQDNEIVTEEIVEDLRVEHEAEVEQAALERRLRLKQAASFASIGLGLILGVVTIFLHRRQSRSREA